MGLFTAEQERAILLAMQKGVGEWFTFQELLRFYILELERFDSPIELDPGGGREAVASALGMKDSTQIGSTMRSVLDRPGQERPKSKDKFREFTVWHLELLAAYLAERGEKLPHVKILTQLLEIALNMSSGSISASDLKRNIATGAVRGRKRKPAQEKQPNQGYFNVPARPSRQHHQTRGKRTNRSDK